VLAMFTALMPIFLVIALGIGLRRWLAPDVTFWRTVERITYFVLFPSLLVHTLMTTSLPDGEVLTSLLSLLLPAIAVTLLVLALRKALGLNGKDFPSFLMGAIRFNSYAGMAAAYALYGDDGLALFALLLAAYIPTVNVISTAALARYASPTGASIPAVLQAIATNPVVVACVIGLSMNLLEIRLPLVLDRTLAILGAAALGFGLISVGAALHLQSMRSDKRTIALASLLKLFVLPFFAWVFCSMLGVDGYAKSIVVLFAALPCSPAAYVLARQMGGNAELMAGIISAGTAGAILSIPIVLALFG
jgi:malonate transporter and related proteins